MNSLIKEIESLQISLDQLNKNSCDNKNTVNSQRLIELSTSLDKLIARYQKENITLKAKK